MDIIFEPLDFMARTDLCGFLSLVLSWFGEVLRVLRNALRKRPPLTIEQQKCLLYLLHQVLLDLQVLAYRGKGEEAEMLADIFDNLPRDLCQEKPLWPLYLSAPIQRTFWRTTDYPSRVRMIKQQKLSFYPAIAKNSSTMPTGQYRALLNLLHNLLSEIRYRSWQEELETVEALAKVFQDLPLQMLMGKVNWSFYLEVLPPLQQRYRLHNDFANLLRIAQENL
jgi:hypothetical protein